MFNGSYIIIVFLHFFLKYKGGVTSSGDIPHRSQGIYLRTMRTH